MIEVALYIALGVFLASILALAALPFVWGRAVRLTRKAIETSNPISYARATMAKDALRAQHAITLRQMEVRLEQMTEKLAENASARSLAEAKLAELKEELSVVQLKSARERKNMAQKATRFLRRQNLSEPIPFSVEDRITTEPDSATEAQAEEQKASAEIIQLNQQGAAEKLRELEQEPADTPEAGKVIAPVDTSDLKDMDNPLAELATQISKQVSEMTAESDTKHQPTSPAEAAKLASQSFTKLKSRYSSLESERDKLLHALELEKAAKKTATNKSSAKSDNNSPEQMKRLETDLEDAKKTIEQLTKQLEERANSSAKIEEAVDLRNELKDLAAQISARAIAENPPLSEKYDEVLKGLDDLAGAGKKEPAKPKTRRKRTTTKTTKPRTRKTTASKTAAAAKADAAAPVPEADKDLAERISEARKTSGSRG